MWGFESDCTWKMRIIVQKKKHRQLRTVLCGRCRLLSHGHMITAVGGNGGYSGGKQFVTAEQLREKLSHLRHEKALIIKLVSVTCLTFALRRTNELLVSCRFALALAILISGVRW